METARLTSGLKTHCGCRRSYKRRSEIDFPKEYLSKYKKCNNCGNEKEYREFYFREYIDANSVKQYYFHPNCIKCDKKDAIIWSNRNIEKKRESCRKNSYTPKTKKYHKFNSQRQRENGYRRNWEENNKDKLAEYFQYKLMHKKHEITDTEWLMCKDYFKNKCAYCGMTEDEHREVYNQQLHKEHVFNNGSNGIDNCVPACKSCNSSKAAHDYTDWYIKSNPNFNKERFCRIEEWLEMSKLTE